VWGVHLCLGARAGAGVIFCHPLALSFFVVQNASLSYLIICQISHSISETVRGQTLLSRRHLLAATGSLGRRTRARPLAIESTVAVPWPTRRRHRGACRQSSRSDSSSARLVGQPSALSSLRRKSVWALPLRKAHLAVAPHGTHAVPLNTGVESAWSFGRVGPRLVCSKTGQNVQSSIRDDEGSRRRRALGV